MQKVSREYKDSMKSSLRERAYIMVSFGLINLEAQRKATVDDGDFAYYSDVSKVFDEKSESIVYATLEENFTKVDGSMLFLPRENDSGVYLDNGIVSDQLVSDAVFELEIGLNIAATSFKGLTVDFGENYPVDFDLVGSDGQTIEFRGNTESLFTTEEVLENTTSIRLVVYAMKNPQSRVRIYQIRFGYGLVYTNADVMSSTLDSYTSPIGADVPQVDFTVKLKNYNHYFNVDNPKSAVNFLETGQEMDIYYGYELPNSGEIEWIKGNHLLCSEWESDDYTATIRCHDVLRTMDGEYYRGQYDENGVSYYDLAMSVLSEAGIEDAYVDPQLKSLYTKNPLPRVAYREALQIIANACRCVLTQTRDGAIQIKSSFIPESFASAATEAAYSNVENILNNEEKVEYAALYPNYTTVGGHMFFLPRDVSKANLYTGYVSAEVSGENRRFESNPKITITQEAACKYYGVRLVFGQTVPAEFIIRTYNDGNLVAENTIRDEIGRDTVLHIEFDDFDVMEIEFTRTAEPYSRIVLNNFSFGDVTDFTMTRTDMTTSPKAIKQEQVKEVIVPCYSYQPGATEESLVSEDVTVTKGSRETFYIGEASYGFKAKLNDSTSGVTVVDSGAYFVTLEFSVDGEYRLEVSGYRYKITERYAVCSLNNRGRTIKWENPLVSDMTIATDLADWLGDYYRSALEYEYSTRGNPEIDVNDIIYQENEFLKDMTVNVYRYTLNFNQSFSGKVTARKIGGLV